MFLIFMYFLILVYHIFSLCYILQTLLGKFCLWALMIAINVSVAIANFVHLEKGLFFCFFLLSGGVEISTVYLKKKGKLRNECVSSGNNRGFA